MPSHPHDAAAAAPPILFPFSKMAPARPEYFWWPYVPRGKLVLLEGDEASGKTWLAVELAAWITQGKTLPGPEKPKGEMPRRVLYWSSQHDAAEMLHERFQAAGADLSRISFLTSSADNDPLGKGRCFPTLSDPEELSKALQRERPALLVLDGIECYLLKRSARFGRVLATLAAEHRCTILAIRRKARTPAGRPINLGPDDVAAVASSLLLCARDPENPRHRVLLQTKAYHSLEGKAAGFRIRDGRLRWTEIKDFTEDELLRPAKKPEDGKPGAVEEAENFLQESLQDGEKLSAEILKSAKGRGISRRTLFRAKKNLLVEARREGLEWKWKLEDPSKKAGTLGTLDKTTPNQESRAFLGMLEKEQRGRERRYGSFDSFKQEEEEARAVA
ncbi:MAG: AAA family ATPase [Bdellovibrionota bacterium]